MNALCQKIQDAISFALDNSMELIDASCKFANKSTDLLDVNDLSSVLPILKEKIKSSAKDERKAKKAIKNLEILKARTALQSLSL